MHLPGGKKPRLVNPQHLSRGNGLEEFISLEALECLRPGEPFGFEHSDRQLDGASVVTGLPESDSTAATISRESVVFPLPAGPCSVVTRSFDSRTA